MGGAGEALYRIKGVALGVAAGGSVPVSSRFTVTAAAEAA